MKLALRLIFCLLLLVSASIARAEGPVVEPLLSDLQQPCGVAIQPETGHVFVADRTAQKVFRYIPAEKRLEEAIVGIEKQTEIGPLAIDITDDGKQLIVVGMGDGELRVLLYEMPPVGKMVDAEAARFHAPDHDRQNDVGFAGVATAANAVYVISNRAENEGRILRGALTDEGVPKAQTLASLGDESGKMRIPSISLCVSPRGELLVGYQSQTNDARGSQIAFFDTDGRLLLDLPVELHEIVALAYSPKEPHLLYALDFSSANPSEGGLYRLDAALENNRLAVAAQKIAPIERPTAMAFDKEGNLYITALGPTGDDGKPAGQLLRIESGL